MEFAAAYRRPLPATVPLGPPDAAERIEVSLYLRRRAPLPPGIGGDGRFLTRRELRERHGADPADAALVRETLGDYGIEVVESDAGSRRLVVAGSLGAVSSVFGVEVSSVRTAAQHAPDGTVHRYRTGALTLPDTLHGVVTAVLGIDNRPQARTQFRYKAAAAADVSYTPNQVGAAYGFPQAADGTGQHIALIELGGGFAQSDLDSYFASVGVTGPTVTAVPVDGGSNAPSGDGSGPDGEVMLDIEVAGALAPGAAQSVYFAPNTDQGFADALTAAVHATPTPTAISISWGGPEDSWTEQARQTMDEACADAVALGITVLVAAGDNGSADGEDDGKAHCDFPASSPHVLACGGTSLRLDSSTGKIAAETVWNDGSRGGATGGGVSTAFPLPSWQTGAGVPGGGRGVPDVSGNADPETGYRVLVDGQAAVVGGTSAVAPLWAALVCRLAQQAGRRLGLMQTTLYADIQTGIAQPGFSDILTGDNGAYTAGPGWDACTGLGSPDGSALGSLFEPSASSAP